MCGSSFEEASTMPRSFLVKKNLNNNYSHCPLKKRPLSYFLQESLEAEAHHSTIVAADVPVNEEPENLSLKPEDRYAAAERERQQQQKRLRALLEAASSSLHQVGATSPTSSVSPPPAHHQAAKSCWTAETVITKTSSPLEPLHLNNQQITASAVPYQYAPYLPFNFPAYRATHPAGQISPLYPVAMVATASSPQLSPYAPCESSSQRAHWPESVSNKLSESGSGSDIEDLSSSSPAGSEEGEFSSVHRHHHLNHRHLPGSATPSPQHMLIQLPISSKKSTSSSASSTTSTSSSNSTSAGSTASRYQCPDCHKSYSTYCGLTKHQELHCQAGQNSAAANAAKKSFSCKHCEKVYVSLGALKMHIRTHTLPCKCLLCGKAFSRPWLLQGHIRTHTGEKPFSCQHCSRSFADRSNLRAHLQTHSDVKRYSCKSCGKTFSRMSLLSKHEDGGCGGGVAGHNNLIQQQQAKRELA